MASKHINRTTMFKVPGGDEAKDKVLQAYNELAASDPQRDGRAYIRSCKPYKLYDDPRSEGFTICVNMVFDNVDDMTYYDQHCQAHVELKNKIRPLVGGPPLVIYMDA